MAKRISPKDTKQKIGRSRFAVSLVVVNAAVPQAMATLEEVSGLSGVSREKAIAMFSSIRWDDYVRTNAFVTKEEVAVLQRTEDSSLDVTLGDQDETRRLVLVLQKVLDKIKSDRTVQQYALTRIDDILSGKYDRAPSRPEVLGAAELAQVSIRALPLFSVLVVLLLYIVSSFDDF